MRDTIGTRLRIFSLTLIIISVVSFSHISCSELYFRKCLENELRAIEKIMKATPTKDNHAHPLTEIKPNRQLDDTLISFRTNPTDKDVQNPREECYIVRKRKDPTRKFFFWPWHKWYGWHPWKPKPHQWHPPPGTYKPLNGFGVYGEITGPLGFGIGGGFTSYYTDDSKRQVTNVVPPKVTDEKNDYPNPNELDHEVGYSDLDGIVDDYDDILQHDVGFDRSMLKNIYNGFNNNNYNKPLYGNKYHLYDIQPYNNYNNKNQYIPNKYDQYVGYYYPQNWMDTQPNDNYYSNSIVNTNNKYPIYDAYNDRLYNQNKFSYYGYPNNKDTYNYNAVSDFQPNTDQIYNRDRNFWDKKIETKYDDLNFDEDLNSQEEHSFFMERKQDTDKYDYLFDENRLKTPIQGN